MASVLIGVLAFFSASLVGIWLKKRAISKWKFYHAFQEYLLFAAEKISSERMPRAEIDAAFRGESKDFLALLKGGKEALSLKDEEVLSVKEYLDSIGTSDAEAQLSSLRGKNSEIKRLLDTDGEKWRKDASLYFKLCVLVGVALFIILV